MFKKRLFAYIIDVLILSVILSFISFIIPTSSNVANLDNELINISNDFIDGNIEIDTYINQYSSVTYSMDKELFLYSLVSVIVSICYFVVIPIYNNGQSIGKKINNIKIVNIDDSEVSSNGLVLRYLLIGDIGVSILSMCLIFILKDLYYVIGISIFSLLQFLVVISSAFMILYRRDKRSFPDLIAGTKVIEVEK